MVKDNGTFSKADVHRAAKILITASGTSSEKTIARAEHQLEISLVKPFAAAVLAEVKRLYAEADTDVKH